MKLCLCLFAINLLLLLLLLLWLKNIFPDFRKEIILPSKFLISVSWQCPFLFPSYSTVIVSSSCFPTTGSQLYSSTGSSGKTWGEWWSFLVSFNCWLTLNLYVSVVFTCRAFSWILLLQMRFKRLCKANILIYICQEVSYFSTGLSGQLLIYNWNCSKLSTLEISIVTLLILCHIIIIMLVLRSHYLCTFSYIVLILAWVIMSGLLKGVNGFLEALGVMWTNF